MALLPSYKIVLLALVVLVTVSTESSDHASSVVFTPIILQEFAGVDDVTLRHVVIPATVLHCRWYFLSTATPPNCPSRNFTVVLSQGKLPLDVLDYHMRNQHWDSPKRTPDGTTVYVVQSRTSAQEEATVVVERPLPGRWYAVVASQNSIDSGCEYKVQIVLDWDMSSDLLTLHPQQHTETTLTPNRSFQMFRVPSLLSSRRFVMTLSECSLTSTNKSFISNGCSRDVFIRAEGLSAHTVTPGTSYFQCSLTGTCAVEEVMDYGREYYVTITVNNWTPNVTSATFDILMETVGCELKYISEVSTEVSCAEEASFGLYPLNLLDTEFYFSHNEGYTNVTDGNLQPRSLFNVLHVEELPRAYHFRLDELYHAGGSLNISVQVADPQHPDMSFEKPPHLEPQLIELCLQQSAVIGPHPSQHCSSAYRGLLHPTTTSTGNWSLSWTLPYPRTGSWYVVTRKRCLAAPITRFVYKYQAISEERMDVVTCKEDTVLHIEVKVTSCPSDCSGHGTCQAKSQQGLTYGYCQCNPGWQSFDCSQQDTSWSLKGVLVPTALLAGSSLLLLPAIILCLCRRHLVEAVVYCFTMVISVLHHVCDMAVSISPGACVFSYQTLAEFDVMASIFSFWVTLIMVADMKDKWRPLLYVCCMFFLMLAAKLEYHAAWLYIIPSAFGILFVLSGWIMKICQRGSFTYSRRSVVQHIIGILLAGIGIALLYLADSPSMHMYIHTSWHVISALSILLFIPVRRYCINHLRPLEEDNKAGDVQNLKLSWAKALCLKLSWCCPQNKGLHLGYRVCSTGDLETTDHVLLSDDIGGPMGTEYSLRTAAAI